MEQGIGQLKRRFCVLRSEVRLNPEKTCKMINVCAVLHNFCKVRNIPMPDDNVSDVVEETGEANQDVQLHLDPAIPAAHKGYPFQDYSIANLHFK